MSEAPSQPRRLSEVPPTAALVRAFAGRYARRYLGVYALGVGFLVATNWLTVTMPVLVKDVFDRLQAGIEADELMPALIRRVFHSQRSNIELVEINRLALWIAACAVAVIVVRTLSRVLFFNPGRTIEFRLRNDMLDRLLAMGGDFFRDVAQGDVVSRATNDATFVRALVGFAVLNLLNLVLSAGMALWRMLQTDVTLTLLCLVPMSLAFLVLRHGTGKLFGAMRAGQVELGGLSDHILETYKGMAAIAVAHAEPAFIARFDRHNRRYTEINLAVTALRCFILPLASQTGGLAVFVLLFYGGAKVATGALTVGDLAAYAAYIGVLISSLVMAGWLVASLQRGIVALERCWEILGLQPQRGHGTQSLPAVEGGARVDIEGLTFRYANAGDDEAPALRDLDIHVPAGGVLGIYGAVGSGKSTLVALLGGELQAPDGTIAIDGIDIGALRTDSLAEAVSVVPQSSFLFSRSLRENVGFIDPPEQIDDARVARALAAAQLEGELDRLPKGVDTVVGERGQMLSGGQRQRAQLARAFYRGTRLLILDDVLSAVDHETEVRLLRAIREQLGEGAARPTAIIVSSRLSALRHADEIVVLEDGVIVERGRHDALVAAGGRYAEAYATQREDDAAEASAA
ncbi:MAG: hypothetical protein RIT45_1447 [Pseudomonadota bacterium]|jgi:ATP-binding cassette subfamily B protein